jgi:hypothetical protein
MLLGHSAVGGDTLALGEQEHVARHDLLGRDACADAASHDDCLVAERVGEGEDGALGHELLPEAEEAVEHQHRRDRDGLDDVPDRHRHGHCADEEQHKGVDDLVAEQPEVAGPGGAARAVPPVEDEPRP